MTPMATYLGTTRDDTINGPLVASDSDRIDALEGNDTATLGSNQTFVSGPGDDIVIGTNGASGYALWFAKSIPYVDLQLGYALDGFGGRDQLSGIGTVHLSGLGGTVFGSSNNETVWAFGGQKNIDMSAGVDTVIYYQQQSTSYDIVLIGMESGLRNLTSGLTDILNNVEYIKFDDKTINVAYEQAKLKAAFQYTAYSFTETGMAPGYVYADVSYPPSLVSWFVQAPFTLDLDGDGKLDIVAPMNKGYASGLDTRVPFIALTGASGTLKFDLSINASMPVTAGARRENSIYLLSSGTDGVVTVAHDTGDGKLADLTVLTNKLAGPPLSSYMPSLPAALLSRNYAVNAHSMTVGDINGDTFDDILVGDWSSTNGMYALLQQADGKFNISYQDAYRSIISNWPRVNPDAGQKNNLLIDLHLVDVNGDDYKDLIAGWGHGSTHSYVFLNNRGIFSVDNKIALPDSIYGIDNQLHMKTLPFDFNNDGAMDLAILWSRNEPYYGGNYIQLLQNDGSGYFTDVTTTRIDKPAQDAMGSRLQWTNYWQLMDVNGDGALDIVGQRTGASASPVVYLNDGSGKFTVTEIPTVDLDVGQVIQWVDLDQDGAVELVSFSSKWNNSLGTASDNQFNVFKLLGDALLLSRSNPIKNGTELNDVLVGTISNDLLARKGGNDIINGLAGVDTAAFSGNRANYTVSKTTTGLTVSSSAEGIDTLANVERLKFADTAIAFDTSGVGGQTYRVYKAAFNRTPDVGGLGFWISGMDGGLSLNAVAQGFVNSAEFKAVYGASPTNAQIVTRFYDNVLGRAAESGGYNYWLGILDSGNANVAQVLASFSESPENQAAVIGVIGNGILYTPYG